MRLTNVFSASGLLLATFVLAGCVITAVERVVEARSAGDIVTDNEIVIDVNAIMADLGTLKASTEIYEQRLLVTGMFDDKALYDEFHQRVGTYNPMLAKDHPDRVMLKQERIQHWLDHGAKPTDRVAKFLANADMMELPERPEQTKQHLPREKTLERLREKEEAAKAAAEAPVEEAPAEDAPAEEAPAEDAPAEEAAAEDAYRMRWCATSVPWTGLIFPLRRWSVMPRSPGTMRMDRSCSPRRISPAASVTSWVTRRPVDPRTAGRPTLRWPEID